MTHRPHRPSSRRRLLAGAAALTAAIAVAVPAATAQASPAATTPRSALVAVAAAPSLPRGAHVLGALPGSTRTSGAVALRLRDPAAVARFIDATSDTRSPQFHHYLGRGEFAQRFGPTAAALAAVRRTLVGDGLSVTSVSANRLLVSFTGTASRIEAAFHTGLERVRLADGHVGQATTTAVRLPSSIAHDVVAVVGLDRLVHETDGLEWAHARPGAARRAGVAPRTSGGGPVACSNALAQQENGALTDQQVAASYGLDPLYGASDLAATQTVDVYELEPFLTSDVAGFDECYFGADHTSQLTVTAVDGGPGSGPGGGEAALDVEDVSALAPGAKIHVFSGPNMDDQFGPLDTWNAIAVADDAGQITSSWGVCETSLQEGAPGVQQVENEIFEQTAAQGQTVFVAAGDDGSDDCAGHASVPVAADLSVDDPASQPYVTSVGGTTILNPTEPPDETVWNNGDDGGAGGGGISETWAMQPWQAPLAVSQTSATEPCSNDPTGAADEFHTQGLATTLPASTTCREVPDVSALADPQTGITIEYGGQWSQIGGTSSSTPLWAAMLAEVSGSSGCTGLSGGVGFADPLLYQVADSSAPDYAAAFSDVTVGNNDNLGVGGAVDWQAGTGYDLATGLGTPRITDSNGDLGLASQLCTLAAGTEAVAPPVVTSLSSSSGTVAGGGSLTISGNGFGGSTGAVYFGTVAASVVTWGATSITITIPPYYEPESSPSGTGGSVDVTVVTAGTPPESSAPHAASRYHYVVDPSGAPVVDYVSAPTGPAAGGTHATIVGTGLTGALSVHFGDVAATGLTVLSDDELGVTVPASDATCAVPSTQGVCAVNVTVTTPSGTSSAGTILPAYEGPIVFAPDGSFSAPAGCGCEVAPAPDEYDYAAAPTITSVAPAYTSEIGGTVTVTGSGFNLLDLEWANVGTAGQNFSEDFDVEGITPDSIVFGVPGAAFSVEPESVPFSVQTAGGLSNVSSIDYAGIPVVTSLSKHVAPEPDPGSLTVTGHGLADVSSIVVQLQGQLSFLSSSSTAITDQTDTSLTVALPEGYSAPADVLACSVTSCSAPDPAVDSLTLVYPGRPVVHSSSPPSGPAHGGTLVTIQGALDSDLTAVDFGSVPATIVSEPEFTASGPITVVAPPGTAGTKVDLTITTLGGTVADPPAPRSAVTSLATFTYEASTPSAPRSVSATAGVGRATVRWAVPADSGGHAITGYVVTATATGHRTVVRHLRSTTRSTTLSLKAGVLWTVKVQATNSLGAGLAATTTTKPT